MQLSYWFCAAAERTGAYYEDFFALPLGRTGGFFGAGLW
jgi:hypothetical protein